MTVRLVAFDLDGTLLRGETACEVMARPPGRLERMRELERTQVSRIDEIKTFREEMASWYASSTVSELSAHLNSARLAPGVEEGFQLLHMHRIKIAIISLTWEFAVEWVARRCGADFFVGTGLSAEGRITRFWPRDKPRWSRDLARRLDTDMGDVAAVGDSAGDF